MWVQTLYVCLGSVQEDFFRSGTSKGFSKCVSLAGNSTLDLFSCILEYKLESAESCDSVRGQSRGKQVEKGAMWGKCSFNSDGCLCI